MVDSEWRVDLADTGLSEIVENWRGYEALSDVLVRADRFWRQREDYAVRSPTSVPASHAANDARDRWQSDINRKFVAPTSSVRVDEVGCNRDLGR